MHARSFSRPYNSLTSATSFNRLLYLESLDISGNRLDSLTRTTHLLSPSDELAKPTALLELQCLRHLRELRADGNRITSLDGLQMLEGLVKLSLEANAIKDADFSDCCWCVRFLRFCSSELSMSDLMCVIDTVSHTYRCL